MQQEKKETENSNDNDVMRKDYTNLQLVYGAKLCIFTIVSIATILQTLNNFQALIAGGFTYCVGILFDFVVIIFTNNGPKTKHLLLCKIALGITVFVVSIPVVLWLSNYRLSEEFENVFSWIIRVSMVCCGILDPYTELKLNKPNDD